MYIGVDLGGTNITIGLMNNALEIVKKISKPARATRSSDEILMDIKTMCDELIESSEEPVKGIGIGVPGFVKNDFEYLYYCPNINLVDINIRAWFEEYYDFPVVVANDGNLAALGERELGSLQGEDNAVLLTLGTGIGGGFIVDGKLQTGNKGIASEVGHMMIGDNFYDCNCGKNGCFETFSSATAVKKYAIKLVDEGEFETEIGYIDEISPKLVFDLAKKGDPLCLKVIERFAKYMAKGCSNMIHLYDPAVISIGGGLSHAGPFLIEQVEKHLDKYLLKPFHEDVKLVLATLGNDAGIIGAGALARNYEA